MLLFSLSENCQNSYDDYFNLRQSIWKYRRFENISVTKYNIENISITMSSKVTRLLLNHATAFQMIYNKSISSHSYNKNAHFFSVVLLKYWCSPFFNKTVENSVRNEIITIICLVFWAAISMFSSETFNYIKCETIFYISIRANKVF